MKTPFLETQGDHETYVGGTAKWETLAKELMRET